MLLLYGNIVMTSTERMHSNIRMISFVFPRNITWIFSFAVLFLKLCDFLNAL